MKRPQIISFNAIDANEIISVRCSIGLFEYEENVHQSVVSSPYQFLSFIPDPDFSIKIQGITEQNETVYSRVYQSESYGLLETKFSSSFMGKKIHRLEVYEVSYHHGIELLLGSFLIQKLSHPTKIIISDFDKTLVDTKYSSPREMYQSLRNPLSYFPKIETSIHLLKKYIKKDYHPFILSASPHFYEKPFRDWLYQNGIFTGNIFLKDYKKILSLNESELSFKDIKKQGFYKLNHLVDILLMTGIPDELILMGDGFESDTIIYLVLRSILIENLDPHFIWKSVKELKTFGFNTKQQAKFLIKFNQLAGQIHKKKTQKMKIFIRCKESFYHKVKEFSYNVSFLDQQKEHISFYCA